MKKTNLIFLFSIFCITFFRIKYDVLSSSFNENTNEVEGTIVDISNYSNRNTYTIKSKEKILLNCYECQYDIEVGDRVIVKGKIKIPASNSNTNLFNYRKYLMSKKIYWLMDIDDMKIIKKSDNIFYKIKNIVIKKINKDKYLSVFILGNDDYVSENVKKSYQRNGISHLFSLSGMHVTLLTTTMLFLLKILIKSKTINTIIISSFLIFFLFLTGFSPSMMRASLLFIVLNIIKMNRLNLLIFIFIIFLIYNPYYIYDNGFCFSFTISFFIILASKNIKKNYFINLFYISLISFIASIPILANSYFEVNLMSFIINLYFVPLVSYIVFPLSLLAFFFTLFKPIFDFFTDLMEQSSIFLNTFNLMLIIPKMHIIVMIVYYFLLYKFIKKNHKYIVLIVLLTMFHSNINLYKFYPEITFINVEQGDSILIEFKNKKILIDTGGNELNNNIGNNILIPYLKSVGVKKINYLILTHGDFDHAGEALNLINNFKIENIIFNSYENNDLEKAIIKKSKTKKINTFFYSKKNLLIENANFYFLNGKHENENNDSLIIYTVLNKKNILLLADATKNEEMNVIKEYNLSNVDILKVGHHGSDTSTSNDLLNLNIKYAIISVGKNNMYNFPSKDIVNRISSKNIPLYMTSISKTIRFVLKNKIILYTCH